MSNNRFERVQSSVTVDETIIFLIPLDIILPKPPKIVTIPTMVLFTHRESRSVGVEGRPWNKVKVLYIKRGWSFS